jgi:hypothetical protein
MSDLYVEGDDTIDAIFERVFADLDQDTKLRLKKEHVTKEKIDWLNANGLELTG